MTDTTNKQTNKQTEEYKKMTQQFTSKGTSVNTIKLPALFKKINLSQHANLLDYGCGKSTFHIYNHVKQYGCYYFSYDKFNQSEADNTKALSVKNFSAITLSNVFNVIAEREVRLDILNHIKSLMTADSTLYITVYEGNKSGQGKQSKKDCWQENRKLSTYLEEVNSVFNTTIQNGMIIAKIARR